jgi:hypothetical protein
MKQLLSHAGWAIHKVPAGTDVYEADGLASIHDHSFIKDPRFRAAYERGIAAAGDYRWHWRVHIGLWAAETASRLDGDFVECGVNRGFLSSAIMKYLDWDSLGKTFYLLDTFSGIDERQAADAASIQLNEKHVREGFYVRGADTAIANFAEWNNVKIIEGAVPQTLAQVDARRIAYLHLDMNNPKPETAALRYFWDKLTPGAVILLDDYAFAGYGSQKTALDAVSRELGRPIASLPTGQGLLLR